VGMFLPFVRDWAAFGGTLCGLAASFAMGYWKQLGEQLVAWGALETAPPSLSFTWVMPTAVATTLVASALLSVVDPSPRRALGNLSWFGGRGETSPT
jgi:hypothetical protein